MFHYFALMFTMSSDEDCHTSRPATKPALWTLRKVSTLISLSMPRRLIRTDSFRLMWIFCYRNHYSIPLSPWDGMSRPGSVCADSAGWSGSIHYADAIMLVFVVGRLICGKGLNGALSVPFFIETTLNRSAILRQIHLFPENLQKSNQNENTINVGCYGVK